SAAQPGRHGARGDIKKGRYVSHGHLFKCMEHENGAQRVVHRLQNPIEQLSVALSLREEIRRLLRARPIDEYFIRDFTLACQAAAKVSGCVLATPEQERALFTRLYFRQASSYHEEHLLYAV